MKDKKFLENEVKVKVFVYDDKTKEYNIAFIGIYSYNDLYINSINDCFELQLKDVESSDLVCLFKQRFDDIRFNLEDNILLVFLR